MSHGHDRIVVVTGGSRGLGREIALAFSKAGDSVVVNYRSDRTAAEGTVDTIQRAGGRAVACRADVGIEDEAAALVQAAVSRWGRIDVLVNNAGMTKDGLLLRMSEHDWDSVLQTNLKGCFHTIRSVAPVMAEQGGGHVINISSIVGVQGREGQANYAASKAALIGLTKAVAVELGGSNIQANAVLPGYLATDMGGNVSEGVLARIREQNVLKRFSDPAEVAWFVHHLSCMRNVSGQVFNLDSRIL